MPRKPGEPHAGRHGKGEDHHCVYSKDCGDLKSGTNEDCSSALLQFASGAHGVYTQVFYIRGGAKARGAKVSGYLGTLDFNWYNNSIIRSRHLQNFTDTVQSEGDMAHFGGDHELAMDFIDIMRGKTKKSRTPIETGIQSVYACLAARESAQKGKFVNVRQVGS